jgi:hypothetical protein
VGAQPQEKIRNMLTVGRSRHLTSGDTAVAHDKIFAQKNKELGLSITGRFPFAGSSFPLKLLYGLR